VSLRLYVLERHLPGMLRQYAFSRVVCAAAGAFGLSAPNLRALATEDAVAAFARFTAEAAGGLVDMPLRRRAVREQLFVEARRLGKRLRFLLGVTSPEETVRALRLLYGAIGIELDGDARSGRLTVSHCAFSNWYTPQVCELMSALDAGIVDGVSGGAGLRFTERITEGAACCRAVLSWRPSK
jgi:hypothetical protein